MGLYGFREKPLGNKRFFAKNPLAGKLADMHIHLDILGSVVANRLNPGFSLGKINLSFICKTQFSI